MILESLRKRSVSDVFDYNLLMNALKGYKAPHRKITLLLHSGAILRIKKGLYIFNENYRRELIHRELIANLLFGPSYISLEYALSHYGFIPERVETVTSMTTQRNKLLLTPLGAYSYQHLNKERFSVGVRWESINSKEHYFIASPEKALADRISFDRDIKTITDMYLHLHENLRIESESLRQLNMSELKVIAEIYRSPSVNLLVKTLLRKK